MVFSAVPGVAPAGTAAHEAKATPPAMTQLDTAIAMLFESLIKQPPWRKRDKGLGSDSAYHGDNSRSGSNRARHSDVMPHDPLTSSPRPTPAKPRDVRLGVESTLPTEAL